MASLPVTSASSLSVMMPSVSGSGQMVKRMSVLVVRSVWVVMAGASLGVR